MSWPSSIPPPVFTSEAINSIVTSIQFHGCSNKYFEGDSESTLSSFSAIGSTTSINNLPKINKMASPSGGQNNKQDFAYAASTPMLPPKTILGQQPATIRMSGSTTSVSTPTSTSVVQGDRKPNYWYTKAWFGAVIAIAAVFTILATFIIWRIVRKRRHKLARAGTESDRKPDHNEPYLQHKGELEGKDNQKVELETEKIDVYFDQGKVLEKESPGAPQIEKRWRGHELPAEELSQEMRVARTP